MRRSADFTATVRHGRRAGAPTLTVHLADPSDAAGSPLVGFVVSRAVGPAVVRNRVRRRLRHLMRARLTGLPPGVGLVIRAQPAAALATSSALATDLDRALRRATSAAVKASR